jgi:hypothetical protein
MKPYRILYADIHNHNAHGDGVGSIERSPDVVGRPVRRRPRRFRAGASHNRST